VSDQDRLVTLFRNLLKLKTTRRTGWLDRGVPPVETESVADHILMASLIGWLTADPALDRDRVIKLMLVHDLAEVITGDPPPYDRDDVPPRDEPEALREFFSRRHIRTVENKTAKDARETEAMASLRALMPDDAGDEIVALWGEYEAQATPEARFAKDLDRFEAFLQARDYARRHPGLPLSGFTKMAQEELESPQLIALRDAILADEGGEA
jgi:putative hydrolase of HD superfamily